MTGQLRRVARLLGIALAAVVLWLALPAGAAEAAPVTQSVSQSVVVVQTDLKTPAPPTAPAEPVAPEGTGSDGDVSVDLTGLTQKPSQSVTMLIGLTLLSLLPAIMLTCTSFTKILVVLGLTRNALGLQQTPPNQVLAGLALFLSLFIMGPVLADMNAEGVQPYLDGDKSTSQAIQDGGAPLKTFMIDHTDDEELALLTNVADKELPDNAEDVQWSTLIPAFVLSELQAAPSSSASSSSSRSS